LARHRSDPHRVLLSHRGAAFLHRNRGRVHRRDLYAGAAPPARVREGPDQLLTKSAPRWLRGFAGDAGVRAAAVSRLIALGGAPVTLYLAATRLPPREQGWYFVAINIVAFAQL